MTSSDPSPSNDRPVTDSPSPVAVPVPAATVILLRDGDDGMEVLMLERVSRGAFAGMWVFPGGRVDDEDRELAGSEDELEAARFAAIREAKEETGMDVSHEDVAVHSHWMPPKTEARRFSTWFFIGKGTGDVVLEPGEATQYRWVKPSDAIAEHADNRLSLAPPTWVTLRSLASFSTVHDAVVHARSNQPRKFETHAVQLKPMVLTWHGDMHYGAEIDAVDLGELGPRHRLTISQTGWVYELSE